MKPLSKAEARWKYWREGDRFSPWAKKMMKRARRRVLNKIDYEN